ncbi:MAG: FHA domain-containing protein, partial [Planctomyces sp.]
MIAPDHLARLDRKTHLGEPLTATERPLRLTLRQHSSNESLDRHILLVAGKTLRMGRANTWSSQHLSHPPNDLVLRVPETSEKVVNYISNTHLMIARRENSLYLHDYSKHGTLIDNRQIHQASLDLTANKGHQKPGTSGADRPESSLRLTYQRVQNHDPEFISKLSEFAQFSGQPAPLNWCNDVLVFNRDDAPETCVFMLDVLRIGYDPAVCGWLLPKRNGNRPVQAVVFRLGDGLWITPGGPGCA